MGMSIRSRYTVAVIIPFAMALLNIVVWVAPREGAELPALIITLAAAGAGALLVGSIPRRLGGRIAVSVLYIFVALLVDLVISFVVGCSLRECTLP